MTQASDYLLALARRTARAYAALPACRAILVTGSAAEGVADRFSDLDMGLYYDTLPTEAELSAAREQNGASERLWMLGDRANGDLMEAYLVEGVECQFGHTTIAAWERDMAVVLEQHEAKTPLHKALSGTLEAIPLHGEALIRGWQARISDFPEGLARKMIEEHLSFFPLWTLHERMAVRDSTLWQHQALLEAAQNILGVLAGLNRLYYTTFQFKRMRAFTDKLTIAPPALTDRLETLFTVEPEEAALQLEALVGETLDLVEAHRPEIDTSAPRRRLGKRLEAWKMI